MSSEKYLSVSGGGVQAKINYNWIILIGSNQNICLFEFHKKNLK